MAEAELTADYVIIGAGSAGSVLANRLTRNPRNSVIVIEAGPSDSNPFIHMPRGVGKLVSDTKVMWHTPVLRDRSVNEPEMWLRGKVLGGSSSVNGMVYFRGYPANYDGLGLPGWGWDDIGPIFKAMEHHELGATAARGGSGPLRISLHPERHPMCEAMISAVEATGVRRALDMNEEDRESVGYQPRTIWRGRRQNTAKAFIRPARSRPTSSTSWCPSIPAISGRWRRRTSRRSAPSPAST